MNRKIYGTFFSITNLYRVINPKNVLLVYICLHSFKGVSRREKNRPMGVAWGAFSYVDKIDGLPKLAPMIEGAFRLRKVLEDTYADAALNEYN